MTHPAIEARDLAKVFPGNVLAVNGFDLAVPQGAVYGLIGRNGAGKTTAIRLMMGLLRANRGESALLGENMLTAPARHRARITFVPQSPRLPQNLTLSEYADEISGYYPRWDSEGFSGMLGRFEVNPRKRFHQMSGGEQRKAAVALALAPRPEALLLDEPAAGLDPVARRELLGALVEALGESEGLTVLLSTHIIGDLERVADHIGIMDRGRIVLSAPLDELRENYCRVQLVFDETDVPPDVKIPGVLREQRSGPVLEAVVRLEHPDQLNSIRALPRTRFREFPLGLEDLFLELQKEGLS
ncbi:MAG: ABC transporter ATP-binding protein [Verrucomicrobia bacterium]|nr:ABC transporter ATP-binding protein [Verrucomicrobiota bacterium]MCH8529151.1 ABC transporter ATP-binding protein [Kiritimatiellia bacterium]